MNGALELVAKLGIKAQSLVVALNANPEILAQIQASLPQGTTLVTDLPADTRAKIVIVWLREEDDLGQTLQRLKRSISPDGAIWAVIPKKIRGKAAGVTFEEVQSAALGIGLVDNKVASFSSREYGIRFVIRRRNRWGSS